MVIDIVPVTLAPSVDVALTIAVPVPVPDVSKPVLEIVALLPPELTTDQVTAGFEAFAGVTVAIICSVWTVWPECFKVVAPPWLVTVIFVTGIKMVIVADPEIFVPSVDVALTVAVPAFVPAVSRPVPEMVALAPPESATDQVTAGLVAVAGVTVAIICSVLYAPTEVAPPRPATVIFITGTKIVMLADPTTPDPSFAVAVTVTVPPCVPAESKPVPEMVALVPPELVTDQVTAGFEAVFGVIMAVICSVFPDPHSTEIAPP
jgi:hypothetical protein